MTLHEYAKKSGVSVRYARYQAAHGRIPGITKVKERIGRYGWRYDVPSNGHALLIEAAAPDSFIVSNLRLIAQYSDTLPLKQALELTERAYRTVSEVVSH